METLKIGSSGADTELLQLALSRSGWYTGAIDGIFGPATQSALIAFQQSFGLTPDGIAGPAVWNALMPYILGYFYRTVRKGDSFWSLAEKYGTTVSAIATANPNVNPDNVSVGIKLVIPFGFSVVPTNISYSSHLTKFVIDGLKARYPFLKINTIGRSVMGKNIYSVSIGSGNTQVSYNAAHHANEWITTPLLLKYIEDYSLAYSLGGKIYGVSASYLYSKNTLFAVPLVNPDGLDLVTGVLKSGIYYVNARTYSLFYPSIPFPSGWKANIAGTDLNLQYPAEWESARTIKFSQGFTRPGPRDYVGPGPLTAPESLAMYNFTLNHNFSLILAYHTQGRVIFWRFLNYYPPNSYEIAQKMSLSSGYSVESTPETSGYAGYKDWFIQQYNRPGYTIEAGLGQNPLPISQFDEIYKNNIGILTTGLLEA